MCMCLPFAPPHYCRLVDEVEGGDLPKLEEGLLLVRSSRVSQSPHCIPKEKDQGRFGKAKKPLQEVLPILQ